MSTFRRELRARMPREPRCWWWITAALWCALAAAQTEIGARKDLDPGAPSTWARYAMGQSSAAAQNIDDPYFKVEALLRLAAVNASFDDLDSARATLRSAHEIARQVSGAPSHDLALRDVGLQWARFGEVDAALDAANAIDASDLRAAVLNAVIGAQIAAGDFSAAKGTAQRLPSASAAEQALRRIAQVQARHNQLSDARATVAEIEDDSIRTIAAADVAAALADIGNADSIERALGMARSIHGKYERDAALVYIALIQAQSRDLVGAIKTLERVKDPASRALGFGRLSTMRSAADDPENAEALLKRALADVRKARPNRARTLALCEIAVAQISRGQKDAARALLQEALQVDSKARVANADVLGLEAIARLQARAGDIAGASATAAQVTDETTRALLVHDIAAAQAESGDINGARATAEALSDARLQVPAWFGIIGVQTAAGDRAGARDSLQTVQERARGLEDLEYRSQSLAAVAAAQVKLDDVLSGWSSFQEAVAAADLLKQNVPRSAAFANVAEPFHDL
ncbi:MAG TPA: hypothetical protein VEZ88_04880 [Steroidobacteraceae bacterium]|nr:hypothetical protein [Steroidobacteraceae bacterium]